VKITHANQLSDIKQNDTSLLKNLNKASSNIIFLLGMAVYNCKSLQVNKGTSKVKMQRKRESINY
jgi:hypothetical protein